MVSSFKIQSLVSSLNDIAQIIVGETFFRNLGAPVASSIIGAIAVVLGVSPFIFYLYGPQIRERSSFSLAVCCNLTSGKSVNKRS